MPNSISFSTITTLITCLTLSTPTVLAIVRRYNTTTIYSGATTIPPWAVFDSVAVNSGNVSRSASTSDDLDLMEPLGICIPFFQSPEPMQVYISPNGMLGLSPDFHCPTYCFISQAPFGGYGFNTASPTTGDYPMISLYYTDLDPKTGYQFSGRIYTWLGNKNYSDGSHYAGIVSFDRIPPWVNAPYYINAYGVLTAQAELWEDGTIIMRFQRVPTALSTAGIAAGTGLIWTKKQRVISPDVTSVNQGNPNIIAIRYDPVPDPCSVNIGCSACAVATGCVWCGPTSECVGSDIVDDVCSVSDRNQCLPPTANNTAQRFYEATWEYDVTFIDITADPKATIIPSLPASIPLNMSFPFFYFPPSPDPNSTFIVRNVTLQTDFTISVVTSDNACSRYGKEIYSDNWPRSPGACVGGTYYFSIVPYGSPMYTSPGLTISKLTLPRRPAGSPFCLGGGTPYCPQTVVIQVKTARIIGQQTAATFQVILQETGEIGIYYQGLFNETSYLRDDPKCGLNINWQQFGTPINGIIQNGASSPSSLLLPWTQIAAGLMLIATPIPGCLDCGGRGYCDPADRQCKCNSNFAGQQCEMCAPGFYGPQCSPCRACLNGGQCNDGLTGNGYCECVAPYSGSNCSVTCPGQYKTCSNGCGVGYCECGTCVCLTGAGYFGGECEKWADPCRQHSLFGCAACGMMSNDEVACEWCPSTITCMASSKQSWVVPPQAGTCSVSPTDFGQCQAPSFHGNTDTQFAIITLVVVFACLALCACLTLFTVCLCRRRPRNPLVLGAVPGVADFGFPRRDREIIGISRLPIQGRGGRPVQGIPLKQIPMRELVLMQREKRKSKPVSTVVDMEANVH